MGLLLGAFLGSFIQFDEKLPKKYTKKYREWSEVGDQLSKRFGDAWQERIWKKFQADPLTPHLRKFTEKFRELKELKNDLSPELIHKLSHFDQKRLLSEIRKGLEINRNVLAKILEIEKELDRLSEQLFEQLKQPWESQPAPSKPLSVKKFFQKLFSRCPEKNKTPPLHSPSEATPRKEPDHYEKPHEVLNIEIDADTRKILLAYRTLILKYHPDKISQHPELNTKRATEIAAALNRAREALLKKRRAA